MRALIFLVVGAIIGYLFGHKSYNIQETYSTLGRKTVIASSSNLQDAMVAVGQSCEDNGYSIVAKDHTKDGFTLIVECGKKEE